MNERVIWSAPEINCNCKVQYYPTFQKITVADYDVFVNPQFRKSRRGVRVTKNPDNEPTAKSLQRAKRRVFDIASLNDFEYFITLTLNPLYIDRENPREVSRKLRTFLSHCVARKSWSYIVVAEYHKDGKGIHLHGLVSGNLKLVDSGKRTNDGKAIYNIPEWRYGFSTCIELTGDKKNAAKYITKYISKDFKKVFGNFYYAGGNIEREPLSEYCEADYEEIDEKEFCVPELGVRFKYLEVEGGEITNDS